MAVFKSAFSRIHFVFMLFAVTNVALGILLALSSPNPAIVSFIHLLAGLLLIPAMFIVPAAMKNRKMVFKALWARLFISKRDLTQKKPLVLAAKIITQLMALGFAVLVVNALFIMTGLGAAVFPGINWMMFHVRFLYIMPVLLLLHPVFVKAAQRHRPAAGKQKDAAHGG